jgi:hypothetical protein
MVLYNLLANNIEGEKGFAYGIAVHQRINSDEIKIKMCILHSDLSTYIYGNISIYMYNGVI